VNFYDDDFIIVTSRVHRTQSVSAVFCPFFRHLSSAKHHCKLPAFSNVKHQHFLVQHNIQIYLNTY